MAERKDCWILSRSPVIEQSSSQVFSPSIQRLQQLMGLATHFRSGHWNVKRFWPELILFITIIVFLSSREPLAGAFIRAALQNVSYQNCIEDCLFLFSYYIFMRGYYGVSTSVFISYFRLRRMTSRLGNDDGRIDYSVINSNYSIV